MEVSPAFLLLEFPVSINTCNRFTPNRLFTMPFIKVIFVFRVFSYSPITFQTITPLRCVCVCSEKACDVNIPHFQPIRYIFRYANKQLLLVLITLLPYVETGLGDAIYLVLRPEFSYSRKNKSLIQLSDQDATFEGFTDQILTYFS